MAGSSNVPKFEARRAALEKRGTTVRSADALGRPGSLKRRSAQRRCDVNIPIPLDMADSA